MNSVKNAIVTMTLLAVGYGAYVILSNPVPDDLGELADASVWEAPEVTTPTAIVDPQGVGTIDQPPPLEGADADALPTAAGGQTDAPDSSGQAAPSALNTLADNSFDAHSLPPANRSTVDDRVDTVPRGELPDQGPTPNASSASATTDDPGHNFYASRSTSSPTVDHPDPAMMADPTQTEIRNNDGGPEAAGNGVRGFDAAWQAAQGELKNGQLSAALAILSAWYETPSLTPPQRDRLIALLDQLAGTVIYSSESIVEPAHVVQSGETLTDLARQYEVPVEFLARVNGIEAPFEVFPGESIKVVRGPFRAEISRAGGEITLFVGKHYAGRFPARIGPELPPGHSSYSVASVEPGLEYFDPQTGNRIARGQPNNPYGPLWIALRGHQITAAHHVGIHVDLGDPKHCCIGVSDVDASDLAAILGSGSTITIKE